MNSQFNKLSIDLTKKLSVKDKKDNGIYFTPMDIVKLTIDSLIKYNKNIVNILEPSCFLISLTDRTVNSSFFYKLKKTVFVLFFCLLLFFI